MSHADSAAGFRRFHDGPALLILPNAWDAGSARLIESLGATAIATTSAGIAWAQGYRDGDALPVELLAGVVRAIVRVVAVPVTVDAEGGYGDDATAVGETVARLIDAGAVGINLEDGALAPDLMCARIAASKAAAARAGVDLFVNARTDVFLRGLAPGRETEEATRRGGLYADAGADGLFIPGAIDAAAIGAVAAGVPLPLNVMARPGLPAAADLPGLGVRRLSAGSSLAQAAMGLTAQLARDFLAGDTGALFSGALGYPELNALMPE